MIVADMERARATQVELGSWHRQALDRAARFCRSRGWWATAAELGRRWGGCGDTWEADFRVLASAGMVERIGRHFGWRVTEAGFAWLGIAPIVATKKRELPSFRSRRFKAQAPARRLAAIGVFETASPAVEVVE